MQNGLITSAHSDLHCRNEILLGIPRSEGPCRFAGNYLNSVKQAGARSETPCSSHKHHLLPQAKQAASICCFDVPLYLQESLTIPSLLRKNSSTGIWKTNTGLMFCCCSTFNILSELTDMFWCIFVAQCQNGELFGLISISEFGKRKFYLDQFIWFWLGFLNSHA